VAVKDRIKNARDNATLHLESPLVSTQERREIIKDLYNATPSADQQRGSFLQQREQLRNLADTVARCFSKSGDAGIDELTSLIQKLDVAPATDNDTTLTETPRTSRSFIRPSSFRAISPIPHSDGPPKVGKIKTLYDKLEKLVPAPDQAEPPPTTLDPASAGVTDLVDYRKGFSRQFCDYWAYKTLNIVKQGPDLVSGHQLADSTAGRAKILKALHENGFEPIVNLAMVSHPEYKITLGLHLPEYRQSNQERQQINAIFYRDRRRSNDRRRSPDKKSDRGRSRDRKKDRTPSRGRSRGNSRDSRSSKSRDRSKSSDKKDKSKSDKKSSHDNEKREKREREPSRTASTNGLTIRLNEAHKMACLKNINCDGKCYKHNCIKCSSSSHITHICPFYFQIGTCTNCPDLKHTTTECQSRIKSRPVTTDDEEKPVIFPSAKGPNDYVSPN